MIHLSIHPFIYSSVHPFVRPYNHPSIHPSTHSQYIYGRLYWSLEIRNSPLPYCISVVQEKPWGSRETVTRGGDQGRGRRGDWGRRGEGTVELRNKVVRGEPKRTSSSP